MAETTAAAVQGACADGHHCTGMDDGACGWRQDGDHHKYRNEDGTLAHDCWKQIDGCWYSFDENDCMRTGWYDCDGERYYLGTDGKMVTGEVTVDGAKWCFDDSGSLSDRTFVCKCGKCKCRKAACAAPLRGAARAAFLDWPRDRTTGTAVP